MKKIVLYFVLCIALNNIILAQSGSIDLTFNPSDIGLGYGDGANNSIRSTAIQSDGKIIIIGDFTTYNGTTRNYIARLNIDGTLDTTFNPGTSANKIINFVEIQSDGKIIIVGNFTSYNGTLISRIARINKDGSLDSSFNLNNGISLGINTISSIAIQSDDKIIIGGGTAGNNIARLNTDGSLDVSFNSGTGTNGPISKIIIQSDGNIILGGNFTTYDGITRNCIARIGTNGSLDSFYPNIIENNKVNTISLQSDGKIIVGGDFVINNQIVKNTIVRLNTNGSRDATFNSGTGANNYINFSMPQSDGKIIIVGDFTSYNGISRNHIARLNTDGSIDTSFNSEIGLNAYIFFSKLQNEDKPVIVGNFAVLGFSTHIARINNNGTFDITFNKGTGANNNVNSIAIQNDGKIIIGGNFTYYNGIPNSRIVRLNKVGELDVSFNSGTGADQMIRTTALQSDGKIIVGGEFTLFNGTSRGHIARLNSDGSLDALFNSSIGTNDGIWSTSIQDDGKIIIVGNFTLYNNVGRNYIARLNTDGSLDVDFNIGTGANNTIYTCAIQNDGKIIIAGDFTSYNGTARNRIARLNLDGTLDLTFNPGTGAINSIYSISFQQDNRIIIAGGFTSFNGAARNYIARLNANGSVDAGFNPIKGANSTIYTCTIQSDGKIIIGGNFTTYNDSLRNHIARLNTDGTLDTSFKSRVGTNLNIQPIALQSDGKIIVGGIFTSYNNIGRNRLARINNNIITTSKLASTYYCQKENISISYNAVGLYNSGNIFSAQLSDASGNFVSPTIIGTITSTQSGLLLAKIPTNQSFGSNYRIRIVSSNPYLVGTDNAENITINPLPSDAGIISGLTTVSQGQNSVNYTIPTISNATTYLWTLPNGAIGTSLTNSIIVNYSHTAVSGNILVSGINSCGNGTSSSLAITVNPFPDTAGTIIGPEIVIQGQNSVTYTVPTILNATSYIWTLPNGVTGTSTSNSITVNYSSTAVSGDITVQGQNVVGVGAISKLAITVNPSITISITGATTVTQGQKSVNYSVTEDLSAVSYDWILPNGVTGSSNTNSITVDFSSNAVSGTISVAITNISQQTTVYTLNVTVEGYIPPIPTTPSITQIGSVLHSDSPSNNQWYNQNGLIVGATNQDYTPSTNGEYYLIVTIDGVNSQPSNTIHITNVGFEVIQNKTIKVYPNPVLNQLTIEIPNNITNVSFEIINSLGQIVFKGNLTDKTIIETLGFPTGLYSIKLQNGKAFEFKKIIKE